MTVIVDAPVRVNDDLGTPAWILERVRSIGPIALDPCSNPWSRVDARVTLSKHDGEDGLARRWSTIVEPPALAYVNPPYSNPKPWCERIIEAADDGLEVVALLKLDPSTQWSATLRSRPRAVCDFHRRISFDGGAHKTGQLASTLVYYGPRPYLFCHVFQDAGEVQVRR